MSVLSPSMNVNGFLSGNSGVAASSVTNSGDFPKVVTSSTSEANGRYSLPKSSFSLNGVALNSTWDQKVLRLASFAKWPPEARANPSTLADAGFFYTGEGAGDTVTCYSCKLKISNWKDEMVPIFEHKKRCESCSVVRNYELRNGSIGQMSDSTPFIPGIPEAAPPVGVPAALPFDNTEDMTVEENRLRTFSSKPGWPANCPQRPTDLAKAGFFYTGDRDKVMCAFCRGRLLNWSLGDSAFGEHMRHFPRCTFLENLAQEAEEREAELARRTASISINSSESDRSNSFQAQGNSGFVGGRIDMWLDTPTVKIVRDLGMSETLIRQALLELANNRVTDLKASDILDIVYRLEDESKTNDNGAEGEANADCPMDTETETNPEQNDSYLHDETLENPSRHLPDDHPLSSLQLENLRLKQSTMCRNCGENLANVLFLPCRHLGSCDKCANDLHKCLVCDQQVLGTVKTFMS